MKDAFPVSEEHIIIVSVQSVHLLDLTRQVFLWSIFVAAPITAAALAPDRPVLALCFPEETVLWDLSKGQVIQRLAHSLSEPESARLAFGPDGILALTSLSDGVQLWNVEAGQLLHTLVDEKGKYMQAPSFKSMEFSPDGELLAIADADYSHIVWLWQVTDGHVYQMLYGHPWSHRILGLAFTPDGRYLVGSEWSTDPEEESMPIWELPSGERIGKLPRMAWFPAISPDGRFVASVNEEVLFLWDLAERKIVWQGDADGDACKLAFDPSGRFLLLSASNNTLHWWNVQDGQKVHILRGADLPRIFNTHHI